MTSSFGVKREQSKAGPFDVSQDPAEDNQKKQHEESSQREATIQNKIPEIITSSPVRSVQSSLRPEKNDKGSQKKTNDTTDEVDILSHSFSKLTTTEREKTFEETFAELEI